MEATKLTTLQDLGFPWLDTSRPETPSAPRLPSVPLSETVNRAAPEKPLQLPPRIVGYKKQARDFTEYTKLRVFNDLHHYAGDATDGLGSAVVREAEARGLQATHTRRGIAPWTEQT